MSCEGGGGALLSFRTPEQALLAAPQCQGSQSLFPFPPMVIALSPCASHSGLDRCPLTTSLSHNHMTLIMITLCVWSHLFILSCMGTKLR